MAKNYAKMSGMKTKNVTPQTEKARPEQIMNEAGGYSFEIGDFQKLNRFLIIGTEKGTYYTGERKLTKSSVSNITKLIEKDGKAVVDRVVKVSDEGLAQKNDQALFVLALCASCDNAETRSYALHNLSKVARISTHLFTFATFVDGMRGWGTGLQKAISRWYNEMNTDRLAIQVCKYASRKVEGEMPWSHRDLLRKAHTVPASPEHAAIYQYVTQGVMKADELPEYVWGHEEAKKDGVNVPELVTKYRLFRESVPTEALKDPKVWEAMLDNGMPITAMIRNLSNMSKNGVLKPMSKCEKIVTNALKDDELLEKGRVHPMNVLSAFRTYSSGQSFRGSGTWTVNQKVLSALNETFYKSFKFIEPSGKNILIAIDASGSMSYPTTVPGISCRDAAAVLAMVTARTEENYHITYFSSGSSGGWGRRSSSSKGFGYKDGINPFPCGPEDRLDTIISKTNRLPWGGTDCALPMLYAMKQNLDVDAFMILTDNDTYAGNIHPFEALKEYRRRSGKNSKLVTVGMVANDFTIADPSDPRQMDICGFDSSTPQLISNFVADKF